MKIIQIIKPIVDRFPIIANYYRLKRDMNYLSSNPKYRKNLGFKFNGPKSMINGDFEIEETQLILKILTNVSSVINIGANIGYYCLYALKLNKYVIAFEPNRLNTTVLLKNIESNGWRDRIEIFPVALSDRLGILPLYGASTGASLVKGWAGQGNSEIVPINTLDNILGSRASA